MQVNLWVSTADKNNISCTPYIRKYIYSSRYRARVLDSASLTRDYDLCMYYAMATVGHTG